MTEDNLSGQLQWYAMSATFRSELKVQEALKDYGIESYIAMVKKIEVKNGRKEMKCVPAVSNLIFVHASETVLKNVKPKISHLQYKINRTDSGNRVIIVRDADMEAFIRITESQENVQYLDPVLNNIPEGSRIKVVSGAFAGMEGTYVRLQKGRRPMVVVTLDNLLAVGVRIPRTDIEAV